MNCFPYALASFSASSLSARLKIARAKSSGEGLGLGFLDSFCLDASGIVSLLSMGPRYKKHVIRFVGCQVRCDIVFLPQIFRS